MYLIHDNRDLTSSDPVDCPIHNLLRDVRQKLEPSVLTEIKRDAITGGMCFGDELIPHVTRSVAAITETESAQIVARWPHDRWVAQLTDSITCNWRTQTR